MLPAVVDTVDSNLIHAMHAQQHSDVEPCACLQRSKQRIFKVNLILDVRLRLLWQSITVRTVAVISVASRVGSRCRVSLQRPFR